MEGSSSLPGGITAIPTASTGIGGFGAPQIPSTTRGKKKKKKTSEVDKPRLAREQSEQERLEKERLEKERLEMERLEMERLEMEQLERERLEKERLEKERLKRERLERLTRERLERERLERERLEEERVAEMVRLEIEQLDRIEKENPLRKEREVLAKTHHEGIIVEASPAGSPLAESTASLLSQPVSSYVSVDFNSISPGSFTAPERPWSPYSAIGFALQDDPEPVREPEPISVDQPRSCARIKRPQIQAELFRSLRDMSLRRSSENLRLVVIGSRGVGKSVLLKSLIGIPILQDDTAATCCPIEFRLQHGLTWSCDIVLRFEENIGETSPSRFKELTFGPTLTDKEEAAQMLRRAQQAIFRTPAESHRFLDDKGLEFVELSSLARYTQNCICARITGPDLPDLYCYDLPGLPIYQSPDISDADMRLVAQLAKSYMSRPSCIVLLVVSCEEEFENQAMCQLVFDSPVIRDKTIGVLTKPDLCNLSKSYRWASIIRNQEQHLKHGWYCVKQMDMSGSVPPPLFDQAEDEYFSSERPWRGLKNSDRDHLGSVQLTKYLESILSERLMESLSNICDKFESEIRSIESDLKQFSIPQSGDPCNEVHSKIMAFTSDLSAHIRGIAEFGKESRFVQELREVYAEFWENIEKTAPRFRPWMRGRTVTEEGLLIKLVEQDDPLSSDGQELYLDEIMKRANRTRTIELSGNYPLSVKETLIKEFWSRWRVSVLDCYEQSQAILNDHVYDLIEEHFGKYEHGGFLEAVESVVQAQLDEKARLGLGRLESIVKVELMAFTQNEQYFINTRAKHLARYKRIYATSQGETTLAARLHNSADVPSNLSTHPDDFNDKISRALAALRDVGFPEDLAQIDLIRLLRTDDVDPAFDIMADVRAYWQVAYKRFADTVPLEIDHEYIRAFEAGIHSALIEGLGLTRGDVREVCTKWLEEDPENVEKRQALMARKTVLEAGRERLTVLRTGGSGSKRVSRSLRRSFRRREQPSASRS
jgi:GTPase SAR1 family protein